MNRDQTKTFATLVDYNFEIYFSLSLPLKLNII